MATGNRTTLADIAKAAADSDNAIWELVYTTQEERTFQRSFTNTFLSWQHIEARLYLIMFALFPTKNAHLLSATFHAVMSLDARLAMITAVAQLSLPKDSPLLTEWGKLVNEVREQARKRNRLAHFSLHQHTNKEDKMELRLRPSVLDARPSKRDYGVKELGEFKAAFTVLEEALMKFGDKCNKVVRR